MARWEFVLLSIGVPVALVTWLYRTKTVEEDTSLWWIGVGTWVVMMFVLGWSFLNDVNVPYGGEVAHHAHHVEEFALVILVTYFYGFGLLMVVLALLLGVAAGFLSAALNRGN